MARSTTTKQSANGAMLRTIQRSPMRRFLRLTAPLIAAETTSTFHQTKGDDLLLSAKVSRTSTSPEGTTITYEIDEAGFKATFDLTVPSDKISIEDAVFEYGCAVGYDWTVLKL